MTNPVGTADALVAELDTALARIRVAPALRQQVEAFRDEAAGLAQKIRDFSENLVPLSFDDGETRLRGAAALWRSLPDGVTRDPVTLAELVSGSSPLSHLGRAGIAVTSVKKFSPDENEFARILGDNFEALREPWNQLKVTPTSATSADLRVARFQLTPLLRLLRVLERLGVGSVADCRYAVYSQGARSFEPFPYADTKASAQLTRNLGNQHPFRVTMSLTGSNGQRSLVTGEWLNSYLYQLVDEHLDALGIPHELYTNVKYRSPAEIVNATSDFDVLVEAKGRIAVFECKSGSLMGAGVHQVADRADGLQAVFDRTGVDLPLHSFLLFNPAATSQQTVTNALSGRAATPLAPDQIRRTLNELFGDHPGGSRASAAARRSTSAEAPDAGREAGNQKTDVLETCRALAEARPDLVDDDSIDSARFGKELRGELADFDLRATGFRTLTALVSTAVGRPLVSRQHTPSPESPTASGTEPEAAGSTPWMEAPRDRLDLREQIRALIEEPSVRDRIDAEIAAVGTVHLATVRAWFMEVAPKLLDGQLLPNFVSVLRWGLSGTEFCLVVSGDQPRLTSRSSGGELVTDLNDEDDLNDPDLVRRVLMASGTSAPDPRVLRAALGELCASLSLPMQRYALVEELISRLPGVATTTINRIIVALVMCGVLSQDADSCIEWASGTPTPEDTLRTLAEDLTRRLEAWGWPDASDRARELADLVGDVAVDETAGP